MRVFSVIFVFLALFTGVTRAEQPMFDQQKADALFHQLLNAQALKDYEAFVAHGTLELKAALGKTQFDAASDFMNNRLKGGYEVDPFGELNQRGLQVFLYRLRFKDGGDDMLGVMSLKDDQVGGIYFK